MAQLNSRYRTRCLADGEVKDEGKTSENESLKPSLQMKA